MTIKTPLTVTLFFISFFTAIGQPNWKEIVSPAFGALIRESTDSIAARRAESEAFRADINKIVLEKGFDRTLLFGEGDKYLKEGMHKHFTQEPTQMRANYDRDKQMEQLEKLHIRLYHSDKALFRWLDIKTRLQSHPDMGLLSRWVRQYNELPEKERCASTADCQKWVTHQLACDIVNAMQPPPPLGQSPNEVSDLGLKFPDQPWSSASAPDNDLNLPLPADSIFASLPMNGQFSFQVTESMRRVGYVTFTPKANSKIVDVILRGDYQLKARWVSAKGEARYTAAKYMNFEQVFYFNFPEVVQPEMTYRLELVALPRSFDASRAEPQTCLQILRGKPVEAKNTTNVRVEGEVKITEWYFRGGKFNLLERFQNMLGTVDWQKGAIFFESEEPFDPTEIFGNAHIPGPASFDVQTLHFSNFDKLNSNELFYYLTVPKVESLENLPLDQLAIAERDNTLDAPFIRKLSLGNPDGYPNVLSPRPKSIRLPGKYLAPAFSPYGAKDSLVTATPVPFITKDHFNKQKTVSFSTTRCTLYLGELQQAIRFATEQQQQLRRRVDERAKFFFELEKRRAARTGKPFTTTLDQMLQQEMENMPPNLKAVMNTNFPDAFKKNFTLLYHKRFPGTTGTLAAFQLNFDTKK